MTPTPRRAFLGAITAVVAATIAASLWVAGSPREARVRAFDDRRAQDLTTLEGMITTHWMARKALPASLDELSSASLGAPIPSDPESGAAYEYRAVSDRRYELCATFSRESPRDGSAYYGRAHGAGRQCFTGEMRDGGR
jgi:hypothetical protein